MDRSTVQLSLALSLGLGCGVVVGLLIASRRRRLPLQLSTNTTGQARHTGTVCVVSSSLFARFRLQIRRISTMLIVNIRWCWLYAMT